MRDLKTQLASALLFVLTVAAVCCAVINFRQQSLYHLPDDGVTWVDRLEATVEAHIEPVARVREERKIPGTSVRTAFLCRDKPAMKQEGEKDESWAPPPPTA